VHGGMFVLDADIKEIVYDDGGRAVGVRVVDKESESGEIVVAKCKQLIGMISFSFVLYVFNIVFVADPSYFLAETSGGKVEQKGQVAKWLLLLGGPPAGPDPVEAAEGGQLIIPAKQAGRHHGIYYL